MFIRNYYDTIKERLYAIIYAYDIQVEREKKIEELEEQIKHIKRSTPKSTYQQMPGKDEDFVKKSIREPFHIYPRQNYKIE